MFALPYTRNRAYSVFRVILLVFHHQYCHYNSHIIPLMSQSHHFTITKLLHHHHHCHRYFHNMYGFRLSKSVRTFHMPPINCNQLGCISIKCDWKHFSIAVPVNASHYLRPTSLYIGLCCIPVPTFHPHLFLMIYTDTKTPTSINEFVLR